MQGDFLLFALTPPRLSITPEKAQEIADITLQRLEPLDLGGVILYDIDEEADRNPEERPFPFFPTMDPAGYLDRHLRPWRTPVVVYRATANYTERGLRAWVESQDAAKRDRRRSSPLRSCTSAGCPYAAGRKRAR